MEAGRKKIKEVQEWSLVVFLSGESRGGGKSVNADAKASVREIRPKPVET